VKDRGFWIGLVLGTPLMVYGVVGLVDMTGWPRSLDVARWFAGGIVLHDLVLVPVALLVVWVLGRVAPSPVRTPLRVAVLASALLLALAWPALRGYGNRPDNATIHPLDYPSAVVTVLVLVWAWALAWSAWRLVRRRARRRAPAPA
jgi:hypothetical protein